MGGQQVESIDPALLLSTDQMMCGMISWQILEPKYCLNAMAYLTIVADLVHPFMAKIYPSYNGYFQNYMMPCHKAQVV